MRTILLLALIGCGKSDSGPEVRTITESGYCADNGDCGPGQAVCELRNRECRPVANYACMTITTRTLGPSKPLDLCWATYGQCQAGQTAAGRDPETASRRPCVIYRMAAK